MGCESACITRTLVNRVSFNFCLAIKMCLMLKSIWQESEVGKIMNFYLKVKLSSSVLKEPRRDKENGLSKRSKFFTCIFWQPIHCIT